MNPHVKTITEIQFREPKVRYNGELLAYVDVVLLDAIKLLDIQLCQNPQGVRYLTFPTRKIAGSEYYNIFHPVDNAFRKMLTQLAVNTFDKIGFGIAKVG